MDNEQKPHRKRINYALAATLLTAGASLAEVARQVNASSPEVLRVGLARKGVTATRARLLPITGERNVSVTQQLASQAAELLIADMGKVLAKTTSNLTKVPCTPNLKRIKAIGEALEPLVRSAKVVYGLGNEGGNTYNFAVLESADPIAIDVPSTSEPIESKQPISSEGEQK